MIVFRESPFAGDKVPARIRLVIVVASFGFLALFQSYLLHNEYVSLDAMRRWTDVMMIWDARGVARSALVLVFPPVPYGVLLILHAIPPLGGPSASYVLDNIAVAGVVGTFAGSVYRRTQSATWSLVLAALVLLNPLMLWIATSGEGHGVLLGTYYLLSAAILRVKLNPDVRAQITLSAALAFLALCDTRFVFIVAALVPLIAFLGDPSTIESSPFSYYAVVLFAPLVVLLTHAYLNWVFLDDALAFVKHVDAPFRGAAGIAPLYPWLRDSGGSLFSPIIDGLGFAALCAPLALFVLPPLASARRLAFVALAISTSVPVLALGLSTAFSYSPHPAPFMGLVLVPTIQSAVLVLERWGRRVVVATLLAFGALGGWMLVTWKPTESMVRWRTALAGPAPLASAMELDLGHWLHDHGDETLVDDRSAYVAIVARQSARNLFLPPSDEFKMAVIGGRVSAAQIVVPQPGSVAAVRDQIAHAFPTLYEHGRAGYRLAYDGAGWRVYRSTSAPAAVHLFATEVAH